MIAAIQSERRWNWSEWVFASTLSAASLPYSAFNGTLFVLGVPAINLAFVLLIIAAILRVRNLPLGPAMWSWTVAILWMVVVGVARSHHADFDWRTFVQDMVICCGPITGFIWARPMQREEVFRILWIGYAINTAMLFISMMLFRAGVFVAATVREVDPANYFSSFYLAAALPILHPRYRRMASRGLVLWGGAAVCVAFGYFSATRSVFAVELAAVALAISATSHQSRAARAKWIARILLIAAASAYVVAAVKLESFGHLGERIAKTQIEQDERYSEIEWIAEAMAPDEWIAGTGFGRSFYSPLTATFGRLVTATHIGILTVLFKGGVVVFFAIALVPLAWTTLMIAKGPSGRYPAYAAVLVFFIQATLSGGYAFLVLFVAGLMFRLVVDAPERNRVGAAGAMWKVGQP